MCQSAKYWVRSNQAEKGQKASLFWMALGSVHSGEPDSPERYLRLRTHMSVNRACSWERQILFGQTKKWWHAVSAMWWEKYPAQGQHDDEVISRTYLLSALLKPAPVPKALYPANSLDLAEKKHGNLSWNIKGLSTSQEDVLIRNASYQHWHAVKVQRWWMVEHGCLQPVCAHQGFLFHKP